VVPFPPCDPPLLACFHFFFLGPELICRLTNCCWCQLRSQCSASALTCNQVLFNASLEQNRKVLIDLVDGLSLGMVVLVRMMMAILRIMMRVSRAEPPNVSQAMAIKRRPLQRHFSLSSKCFHFFALFYVFPNSPTKAGHKEEREPLRIIVTARAQKSHPLLYYS
jgi:hypothetical protein